MPPNNASLPVLPKAARPRREDVAADAVLCDHCAGKCCQYFALRIDRPKNWEDFDYVRWYLLHDRASVFVEEGDWYLLVHTRCKHLAADHRCEIYDRRPRICRDYTTYECEYDDDWVYEHYWETAEQVEEYAEALLGPRPGDGFRSRRPSRS